MTVVPIVGVLLACALVGAVTIKRTAGGTQRLTCTIGKYRAMEMILTGMQVSALEIAAYGLVNCIVPKGEHLNEALKLAREIAEHAPIAVRQAKQAVQAALETPLEEDLNVEHQNVAVVFKTEDMREVCRRL